MNINDNILSVICLKVTKYEDKLDKVYTLYDIYRNEYKEVLYYQLKQALVNKQINVVNIDADSLKYGTPLEFTRVHIITELDITCSINDIDISNIPVYSNIWIGNEQTGFYKLSASNDGTFSIRDYYGKLNSLQINSDRITNVSINTFNTTIQSFNYISYGIPFSVPKSFQERNNNTRKRTYRQYIHMNCGNLHNIEIRTKNCEEITVELYHCLLESLNINKENNRNLKYLYLQFADMQCNNVSISNIEEVYFSEMTVDTMLLENNRLSLLNNIEIKNINKVGINGFEINSLAIYNLHDEMSISGSDMNQNSKFYIKSSKSIVDILRANSYRSSVSKILCGINFNETKFNNRELIGILCGETPLSVEYKIKGDTANSELGKFITKSQLLGVYNTKAFSIDFHTKTLISVDSSAVDNNENILVPPVERIKKYSFRSLYNIDINKIILPSTLKDKYISNYMLPYTHKLNNRKYVEIANFKTLVINSDIRYISPTYQDAAVIIDGKKYDKMSDAPVKQAETALKVKIKSKVFQGTYIIEDEQGNTKEVTTDQIINAIINKQIYLVGYELNLIGQLKRKRSQKK